MKRLQIIILVGVLIGWMPRGWGKDSIDVVIDNGFTVRIYPSYESDDRRTESVSPEIAGSRALAGGDLRGALSFWGEALRNAEVSGDRDSIARLHLGLADLSQRLGDLVEAEAHLRRAASLKRDRPESVSLNEDIPDKLLAIFYDATGRYGESERIWVDLLGRTRDSSAAARAHLDLARHYFLFGKDQSAQDAFARARSMISGSETERDAFSVSELPLIAESYRRQGDCETATSLHAGIIEVMRRALGERDLALAEALDRYSKVLTQCNYPERAKRVQSKAARIRGLLESSHDP